jgi:HAMP domain-containing protein
VSAAAPIWRALAGTRPGRATAPGQEPSLIELLSLADWPRFVPETVGLLAMVLLVGRALPAGFHAPPGMPGGLWIPVLLISAQYGIMGGLFATLAASAAFAAGGLPPQSATQDFYAYTAEIAVQPCAWFATALVLGGLRTLHIHHHNALAGQLAQAELAAGDLARGVEEAAAEIGRLETRIAAESATLAGLLRSLSQLDVSSRRALGDSVCDFIRHGVGATSFAMFLFEPRGLEPCLGVEDGARIAPAAVPPLQPPLLAEIRRGSAGEPEVAMPLWAPMLLPGRAAAFGVVVCYRLEASREAAFARRRLGEVCGVLAALLAACPAREPA